MHLLSRTFQRLNRFLYHLRLLSRELRTQIEALWFFEELIHTSAERVFLHDEPCSRASSSSFSSSLGIDGLYFYVRKAICASSTAPPEVCLLCWRTFPWGKFVNSSLDGSPGKLLPSQSLSAENSHQRKCQCYPRILRDIILGQHVLSTSQLLSLHQTVQTGSNSNNYPVVVGYSMPKSRALWPFIYRNAWFSYRNVRIGSRGAVV